MDNDTRHDYTNSNNTECSNHHAESPDSYATRPVTSPQPKDKFALNNNNNNNNNYFSNNINNNNNNNNTRNGFASNKTNDSLSNHEMNSSTQTTNKLLNNPSNSSTVLSKGSQNSKKSYSSISSSENAIFEDENSNPNMVNYNYYSNIISNLNPAEMSSNDDSSVFIASLDEPAKPTIKNRASTSPVLYKKTNQAKTLSDSTFKQVETDVNTDKSVVVAESELSKCAAANTFETSTLFSKTNANLNAGGSGSGSGGVKSNLTTLANSKMHNSSKFSGSISSITNGILNNSLSASASSLEHSGLANSTPKFSKKMPDMKPVSSSYKKNDLNEASKSRLVTGEQNKRFFTFQYHLAIRRNLSI